MPVPASPELNPEPPSTEEPEPTRPPLRMGPQRPDPAETTTPAATKLEERGPTPGQLALTVGVPVFDEKVIHGDLTVDLRYGHKFWWLVPSVAGGFRQGRLDPEMVPSEAEKKKLFAWHVSLGVRLEIPVTARFFPFVGVSGELAYWAYTANTEDYCAESFYPDSFRCYEPLNYRAGKAIKPVVGFAFKPERSLALELWVERITVSAPDMFTRTVTVYAPAVGVAWHH